MPSFAGSFLVARPSLRDPSFAQTVVLLLQHGVDGAFGLVVNRPTPIAGLPFPVFAGGPCKAQGLLLLHGHSDWAEAASEQPAREVAPGIFLGDASCLNHTTNPAEGTVLRARMFAGYAGWGPNQLEREMAAGAWSVTQATRELLFDTPPEELWDSLAPPAIPQPSLN
jgi:putative transcriptional regulator